MNGLCHVAPELRCQWTKSPLVGVYQEYQELYSDKLAQLTALLRRFRRKPDSNSRIAKTTTWQPSSCEKGKLVKLPKLVDEYDMLGTGYVELPVGGVWKPAKPSRYQQKRKTYQIKMCPTFYFPSKANWNVMLTRKGIPILCLHFIFVKFR